MEKKWAVYEYGNYILAYFSEMWHDIAVEATGARVRPVEVNDGYYELWEHYNATYDVLKSEHKKK
jgi:hypothetical protein